MAKSITTKKVADLDIWVDEKEMAKRLEIKPRTLQNYVSQGKVLEAGIVRSPVTNERRYHVATLLGFQN